MKIWLDDLRNPPPGWAWIKTAEEAWEIIQSSGCIEGLSFDNDLGEGHMEGYELVKKLAEFNLWPSSYIAIHSDNVPARQYMEAIIHRYSPFQLQWVWSRHLGKSILASGPSE